MRGRVYCVGLFLASQMLVEARLDRDSNGVSDLWQALYPSAVLDGEFDSDEDGVSDLEESSAGSNPLDPNSFFHIWLEDLEGNRKLTFSAQPGKIYQLEEFQSPSGWVEIDSPLPGVGYKQSIDLSTTARGIFRLVVKDTDEDLDGLEGWEEFWMGFSDQARFSPLNGYSEATDYFAAFAALEGTGTGYLPGGQSYAKTPPGRGEVFRFLQQASWGADPDLVSEVENQGIAHWLYSQVHDVPQTSIATALNGNASATSANAPYLAGMGIIRASMNYEDQVSQRMANALSEIVVVSTSNDSIRGNFLLQRAYYETLKTHSFGNYREFLEEIAYSAPMGIYLSHLQNQKSDPSIGRFPDENFAREIMQLFTIGLVKLQQNGEPLLDMEGSLIPTYGNQEITELAKIFTGFGYGLGAGFFEGVPGTQWHYPMKMYDAHHEAGEKVLIDGQIVPDGQTGAEDIDDALDILCNHPNVGPFIGRLLIQRLVTSNPSPEYIERVAGVWADDGNGVRGNLSAVATAVLIDPEARDDQSANDAFGRVRGPYERMIAVMRSFRAKNERTGSTADPKYPINLAAARESFVQLPLWSSSVFNFYLPDYQAVGELRDRNLNGPELQIITDSTAILTDNSLRRMVDIGLDATTADELDKVKLDLTDAIAVAANGEALLNYLDDLLTGGSLSESTRAHFLQAYENEPDRDLSKLVKLGIHLLIESPDFVVIK
jgi:uncharacterized protein (DUF1800 family)